MSGDLRSCPFCGSDDIDVWVGPASCRQCWCQGPKRHRAYGDWNTRAPDPAVAVLEAEVARLDKLYEDARRAHADEIISVMYLREELRKMKCP